MKKKVFQNRFFDFSVPLGIFGAFLFIGIGIGLYSSVSAFINAPALLIVLGGTFSATLVSFPPTDVARAFLVTLRLVFGFYPAPEEMGQKIMRASDIVHANGLLALQKTYMSTTRNSSFWANGLNLLIDGISGTECNEIMRARMMNAYASQMNGVAFLNKMGEIAPAMGLVGTLIGLVQMLSTLSDPSAIGPAMAVAMLTTFYGAILAYLICLPLASRLEQMAASTYAQNELCLVGFAAVDKAQNPRKTQMELNALLPSTAQLNYFEG